MKEITVQLPAITRVNYWPVRCRKFREAIVKVPLELVIPQLGKDDAPVAFRWTDTAIVKLKRELRWFNKKLWQPLRPNSPHDDSAPVKLDDLLTNTDETVFGTHYLHVVSGAPEPSLYEKYKSLGELELEPDVRRVSLTAHFYDIHEQVEALDLIAIDGILWRPASEPRYCITTFGMGGNHGGTALFIDQYETQGEMDTHVFPADDLEGALAHARNLALERGDTDSVKSLQPENPIDVLIPEAVTLRNPLKGHGVSIELGSEEAMLDRISDFFGSPAKEGMLLEYISRQKQPDAFRDFLLEKVGEKYRSRLPRHEV